MAGARSEQSDPAKIRRRTRLLLSLCLPWAVWWAWRTERRILKRGRTLTVREMHGARAAGVREPERIRVLAVSEVPVPGPAWARRIAARRGFSPAGIAGMTLRYGIHVRLEYAADFLLLLHECVHVGQYERLGGIRRFLRAYLHECVTTGYDEAPMEHEARLRSLAAAAAVSQ